jgi:hypothetical protein
MSTVVGKKTIEDKDLRLQKAGTDFEQMKGDERDVLHQLHSQGKPMNG